jgi:HAMP domain-containing protein
MSIARRFLLLLSIPALLLVVLAAAWWPLQSIDGHVAAGLGVPTQRLAVLAVAFIILVLVIVGALLWRQLIAPVRTLESAVALISSGTFAVRIPYTKRRDEIGSLARSIDALRTLSVAIDSDRWIKSRVARITALLVRASSIEVFGASLLSELLPELGGGAGALSIADAPGGVLRRVVAYGVAPNTPAPVERLAWRLESSAGLVLGVVDLAPDRFISERERALLTTLMPQVAMLLELLQLRGEASQLPRLPA